MRSGFVVATALLASALFACTLSDPVLNESSTEQAVEASNRLAGNRLAGNRLAGNRLAGNRLAGNRLAGNSLDSTRLVALEATAEILSTEEGRDVYSYVVSCALPEGVTIEADVPGAADTPADATYTCVNEHCTFAGSIGLAPYWAHHRLDRKGKRWVSACLFSRVSATGIAELISLRGDHHGLTVSAQEAAEYTLEEGAFYGNWFIDDPDPSVPPDWNACRGEAKAACSGAGCGGLTNRKCALEDPANPGYTYCGFKYAGDCADFTPDTPSPYACRWYDDADGTYHGCHAESGLGQWPGLARYGQVITTWVAND